MDRPNTKSTEGELRLQRSSQWSKPDSNPGPRLSGLSPTRFGDFPISRIAVLDAPWLGNPKLIDQINSQLARSGSAFNRRRDQQNRYILFDGPDHSTEGAEKSGDSLRS